MRDFIVIVVILVLVFGGNFFQNRYLDSSTKELLDILNEMEENMDISREKKEQLLTKVFDKWEEVEKPWIALQYHQNINQVEDLLIECYTFYLEGEETHFLLNVRKINRHLDDLKNREKISIVNVL